MYRLCQAYVGLVLAPTAEDGSRTTSVARFGAFEVRMIERADQRVRDAADFWIELYRHDTRSSLDSFLCQDLDDGESIVEQLIWCARQLNESQGGSGLSPLSPGNFCASNS